MRAFLTKPMLTALLFSVTGIVLLLTSVHSPGMGGLAWSDPLRMAGILEWISGPLFLVAAVGIFRKARSAYLVSVAAGVVALPYLVLFEVDMRGLGTNCWIVFNGGWSLVHRIDWRLFCGLKIAASALVLASGLLSVLRLLPDRWVVRGAPLNTRSWPAIVAPIVLIAVWFRASVVPYRIPFIVDASIPDLSVLHVQKGGMHFDETRVSVWRDGRFIVLHDNRRWFQYRFPVSSAEGAAPADLTARAMSVAETMRGVKPQYQLKGLRTWNGEGWYVANGWRISAYTSESGSAPPKEIAALFDEMNSLPTSGRVDSFERDICFGFCYDPIAGLGFVYVNQRK